MLHAVTVDHGLRAEAASEAAFVAKFCERIDIPHTIQSIDRDAPTTGLQAWAREVRYETLVAEARARQCSSIATGHHANDQAETVLMRLARGSGLNGLSAMRRRRMIDDVSLLRPLLGVSRERLTATLHARQIAWIDDPSNTDARFERSLYGAHALSLDALGLTPSALTLSARRLGEAADALEWSIHQLLADMPTCLETLNTAAFCQIPRAPFDRLPVDLRRRVLAHVIGCVSGAADRRPRLDRLEDLVDRLCDPAAIARRCTLGGCLVIEESGHIGVYREPGRDGFPVLELAPGTVALWDRRFWVGVPEEIPGTVQVCALPHPPLDSATEPLKDKLQRLPVEARAAIPTFWHDNQLLAIPQIGHVLAPFRIHTQSSDQSEIATGAGAGTFISVPNHGLSSQIWPPS